MNPDPAAARTLARVYGALLLLLILSAALSRAKLGPWNDVLAFAIAAAKAALVGVFFMELGEESPVLWLWMGAGLYWLGILLLFTLADYATRR